MSLNVCVTEIEQNGERGKSVCEYVYACTCVNLYMLVGAGLNVTLCPPTNPQLVL